jgi:hypothetical protein
VQAALYGPTLHEYLFADLIGKTLVEKTAAKPQLIVSDTPAVLPLRSRIEMPVVALRGQLPPSCAEHLDHPRAARGLLLPALFSTDRERVMNALDRVDPAVELTEPFTRIRDAIAEARKMGVSNRAA